jgi:hypothetical protein
MFRASSDVKEGLSISLCVCTCGTLHVSGYLPLLHFSSTPISSRARLSSLLLLPLRYRISLTPQLPGQQVIGAGRQ